jgi:conjugative relaxase-like TrwC/TraI family protein
MMTIKALKGAGQARGYYESEKGIAGYYGHDSAFGGGKWMGQGAEALGMRGAVGVNQFEKALNGHLPGGIEIAHKTDGTHRPGVDLTFSAPKSVSILALAANDQRLIAAHDRAVEKTLRWIEDNHVYARLGTGGTERQITGNLAAAAFRHVTARPVNGITDPQLHTHVVAINATQRMDGKWVSANLGMDQDWIKAAGAIYRMELAREIATLGYGIEQTKDGFEIKGVSRETIERFSCRSGQIEAELQRQGKTRATASASEKDAVNLKTRQGKEKANGADLRQEWATRAQAVGVKQVREAAHARIASGPVPTDYQSVTVTATAAMQSAVRHLSERESAFTKSALIGAAAEFGLGKVSVRDVEKALQESVAVGRLLPATNNRFTTQAAISREQSFIARINHGKDSMAPITAAVPDTLTTATGKVLSPDQRSAAAHILESGDRFTAIQGRAGAGKTTSMEAVREAAEASGFKVVGLAPTHRAATELRDAGISDTRTVASAIRKFRDDRTSEPNTLYVVDEAGMIPARDAAELVAAIERTGGRAAFVGDTRQLQAVEAGSPFRQMQEQTQAVELNEIRRQTNAQLKECVQAFAVGDAARGAELAQTFMHEVKPTEIASQAAEAYTRLSPEERAGTLVITGTNAVRQEINEQIRDHMKAAGELGPQEITAPQLQKIDLTSEQSKHSYNYAPGQTVQFQRDYERGVSEPVERGRQYEVASVDRDRVTLTDRETGQQVEWNPKQAAKVTVSHQAEIGLNDGDRVVFKSTDHERGIVNGDRATIVQNGSELHAVFDKGGIVSLDRAKPEHIEHAYCTTVHSAQGATCDRVIVAAPSESFTATAEQGYVSLSRARQDALVFTDDKAALAEKWGMERTKETAMEVVAEKTATATQEKGQSHDAPAPDHARDQAPTREFSR